MKSLWYCPLLSFIFLFSCSVENKENKNKASDPFESALPHGKSLPDQELSMEDQKKLQTASGREVSLITMDKLTTMLDSLSGTLHAINFWSFNCTECPANNRLLEQVQADLGDSVLQIRHINVDDLENLPQVNASIRAQGLINDCYQLETDSLYNWPTKVQGNWTGALPAIVLINQSDGIRLFYQKAFNQEELMALLQPFTL